jgi:hypothetical protein
MCDSIRKPQFALQEKMQYSHSTDVKEGDFEERKRKVKD